MTSKNFSDKIASCPHDLIPPFIICYQWSRYLKFGSYYLVCQNF